MLELGAPAEGGGERLEAEMRALDVNKTAYFSADRVYRYSLGRHWSEHGVVMFIGLNPSTADESLDDPTIRRCIRFARDWGYGGIYMLNLFAFRSTNPKRLSQVDHPIGDDNNSFLGSYARMSSLVVAAWGVYGELRHRSDDVREALEAQGIPVHHLGLTKYGYPRHPLYLSGATMPKVWTPPGYG